MGSLRHRSVRLAAALTACAAVALAGAPGASAADLWWVTAFKLAQNHTIAAGAGVTVAVLDAEFSPTAPSVQGIDLVAPPANSCIGDDGRTGVTSDTAAANHATQMVSVLAGQGANGPLGAAPKAKVLVYNTGVSRDNSNVIVCRDADGNRQDDDVIGAAINDAVAKGARIVSMSFGGGNLGAATQTAIEFGERKGVVFVASTDDQPDTTGTRVLQPAVFNGVVVVNGIDPDAKLIADSATGSQDGPLVTALGPGADMTVGGWSAPGTWDPGVSITGSSPATAFVAGALATTLSKYPQASGNQLIQSLARNVGGKETGLGVRGTDGYGFGTVSLTSMLAHDPTTYPDENPLLRDGAEPATADILAGSSSAAPSSTAPSSGGSSATGGPTASGSPVAAADAGGLSTGLVVGIVVAVVVVLALVVLAVVLARRGRRPGPPTAGGPPPPVAASHR